jgi:hypothetical protein
MSESRPTVVAPPLRGKPAVWSEELIQAAIASTYGGACASPIFKQLTLTSSTPSTSSTSTPSTSSTSISSTSISSTSISSTSSTSTSSSTLSSTSTSSTSSTLTPADVSYHVDPILLTQTHRSL